MPDKDNSAAVVVVRQIIAPCGQHAGIGDLLSLLSLLAADGTERDLLVHRGEDTADAGERRRLKLRDRGLLGIDAERGIRGRLETDKGIHVKAVDGRMARRFEVGNPLAPSAVNHGRFERCRARIMRKSGTAEPDGRGRRSGRRVRA